MFENIDEKANNCFINNCVDEGILLLEFEKEVIKLNKLIESKKLICPICKTELRPFNFKGYYDDLSGYICECDKFENAEELRGAYTR